MGDPNKDHEIQVQIQTIKKQLPIIGEVELPTKTRKYGTRAMICQARDQRIYGNRK